MPQRHELVILFEIRERQARCPPDKLHRNVPGAFQRLGHRHELGAGWHAVEAARLHADRVNFASAKHAHQIVAGLFQRKRIADEIAVVPRHLDRVGQAEKAGRVQHRYVQRMARYPLAAIDEPPERSELAVHGRAERLLGGVNRAHLIGDGADAADARHDIGQLGVAPAAQKGFEKARRLENPEPRRSHAPVREFEVQRAFALHPGKIIDLDRLRCHGLRFLCGRLPRRS